MKTLKDFQDLDEFLISKTQGAFSPFDMMALETGTSRLKSGDTYVEIGTKGGRSFYTAFHLLPKGVKMHTYDIADIGAAEHYMSRADFFADVGMRDTTTFHQTASAYGAAEWDGDEIHMMFIDADHSYGGVKSDVKMWGPLVKSGGYLYFHDADDVAPGVLRTLAEIVESGEYTDLTFYKDIFESNTSVASVRKV